uniref:Uncharacterized protein n=1 Tax=Noccaea caerulescens TaxID=107243 RepID=A0A1J3EZ39_NOCCA
MWPCRRFLPVEADADDFKYFVEEPLFLSGDESLKVLLHLHHHQSPSSSLTTCCLLLLLRLLFIGLSLSSFFFGDYDDS